MDEMLDAIFGKKEDTISLIKQGKWEEAARFGDHICHNAVTNNEQWIWDQANDMLNITNTSKWNSCSWGNGALLIYYGSSFADRNETVSKLKVHLKFLAKNA